MTEEFFIWVVEDGFDRNHEMFFTTFVKLKVSNWSDWLEWNRSFVSLTSNENCWGTLKKLF